MSEANGSVPPSKPAPAPEGASTPPSTRAASRASADRYRALIEAADEAVIVAAVDTGLCLEANPAACELFGFTAEEFSSRQVASFAPEGSGEFARFANEVRERERAFHPNLTLVRKGGSSFSAELRAKVFESAGSKLLLLIIRDVTLRVEREEELSRAYQSLKDTQAKLVHSGKLAAVGQIAGGVAHEVNNPATFIITNSRVLREHIAILRAKFAKLRRLTERLSALEALAADGEAEALLREANEMVDDNLAGIERIASIVADLRTFSRIEQDDVREVSVNDLVDVACNLAYADIRHRARLIKELRRLPPVVAEPGKLAQVFTTLLVNAAHSIEEGAANENEIRVSTALEPDGNFVVIAVQDTGSIVPEVVRERLFQRFYANSTRDYGTGIGLSLCAELVRLHGGTIDVTAPPGRGSRFEVRLPAAARRPSRPPMTEPPRAKSPPSGKRARILVIDDDLAVLRAYRRMLFVRHDVVLAGGGKHGLAVLAEDADFDVILCDVMMPEVDGPMVYEALVARSPDLLKRVVFCSGGAFTPRAKQFLASIGNAFLSKPIDPEALEKIINDARERRATGA
jgi:PAS domain S-box-containing protein